MSHLQLEAVIKLRDMAMRPLQAFQRQTNESSKALKEMRDRLKEIDRNQATINHFKKLKNELSETTKSLAAAKDKTRNLAQELQAAKTIQNAHTQAVHTASERVKVLSAHQAQHSKEMRDAQTRVKALTEQIRAQKAPSEAMCHELIQTKQSLKNLSKEQQDYQSRLKAAQGVLKAATHELTKNGAAIKILTRDFDGLKKSASALKIEEKQQQEQLQRLRDSLKQAGISTNNLSEHQRRLNRDTQQANQTIAQQQLRLARLADSEKRLNELRNQYRQSQSSNMNTAMTGYASLNTGENIITSMIPMISEAKAYQTQIAKLRAQGATNAEVNHADHFAKTMNIKGSSQLQNLTLLTEANTMFRDMHHAEEVAPLLAKMKFGVEAIMVKAGRGEGHGEVAEKMFMDALRVLELRGELKTPQMFAAALNKMNKSYVSSLGMVTPSELLDAIKTGGTAAKMLDDQSFYYGLNHMIQESGGNRVGTSLMSGFQNLAMGRTTQQAAEDLVGMGLMKPESVKYGTTGHVKKVKVGGLKDIDTYLHNPFKFLNETLIPKINPKGKLSDDEVVFKIASLFSSRKGGDFFVQMFKERANIQKHTDAAPKAFDIESNYKLANQTAKGQEIDWVAKKNDLYRQLGEDILPTYVKALQLTRELIQQTSGWMEQHPKIAKFLTISAASLGVFLIVMGGLGIALAAVLGPIAMFRFALGFLGLKGFGLISILSGLWTALRVVFFAVRGLGLMLLANPITLTIMGIAVAALLIYKYWEPIKGMWDKWLVQPLSRAMEWVANLPSKFMTIGGQIIDGLLQGIDAKWEGLKARIKSLGDMIPDWLKQKLGINSPSRVFAEIGLHTMTGLQQGLRDNQNAPLNTVIGLSKQLKHAATGIMLGASISTATATPLDTRPPLATRVASTGSSHNYTYQITINAAAGMDEKKLANLVMQKIKEAERQKQSARRSSLIDTD